MFKKLYVWKNKENEDIKRFKPKYNHGLSEHQVKKRQKDKLVNNDKVKIGGGYLKIIYKNVFTFFNILLMAIGLALILTNNWASCIFLVILFANLFIGLFNDIRAKRAVDKLNFIEKDKIIVVRGGKEIEILSDELVLDDVIYCEKNSKIPCDSIILKGEGNINESLLTGESLPQRKHEKDLVYGGTYVTNGSFYARIDKIGKDNYIAKLQLKSKEYKEPVSKMFVQLKRLFRIIGIIVIVLGFLQLIEFGLFSILEQNFNIDDLFNWLAGLIPPLAGALISMIPSGMYLLISTALVVGVLKLANNNVLVSDMYSQEALARVDTICMDKTGTITDGEMSVFGYDLFKKDITKDRFDALIASYCDKLGDENQTSMALLKHFKSKRIFEVTDYIPFSSVYKYSAATIKENGTIIIGAYNYFNLTNKEDVSPIIEEKIKSGLRVLVVGLSSEEIINGVIPNNTECIALIYLQDHIRNNAKKCIKWFNENNVNIKIISGDNALTASLIASSAGVKDADKYISLENMSDEEVRKVALNYNVFGRVSPEQKELIIDSLKENEHTVAMIGDGINDVLSLKSADVSIALESGSKATKDIASIVLIDNDFNKISSVIFQGRRVINNLKRTCSLFLTKTVFAVILNIYFLIYALITQFGSSSAVLWPFSPNTFYCWELFTIGVSSFLIALEPNDEIVKGSFISGVLKKAIPHGSVMAIIIIILYVIRYLPGLEFLTNTALVNISTLFITIASFVPLIDISRPYNTYRGLVTSLAVILSGLLYAWSMFGYNWLFINGKDSIAPRFLSNKELLTTFISLIAYFVIYFIYRMIIFYYSKYKKRNG